MFSLYFWQLTWNQDIYRFIMMKLASYIVSLLVVVCCACTPQTDVGLETALSASGDNRPELEKVFHHYKDSTLKLLAAEFLITHMIGFNAPDSSLLAVYQPFYAACEPLKVDKKDNPDLWARRIDTLWRKFTASPEYREVTDAPLLQTVSAAKIIREIDLAFKTWQENPYTKDYPFELFLEYILPFHTGHNFVLDDSRTHYYERFHKEYFRDASIDIRTETDSLLALFKENEYCEFNGSQVKFLHPDALLQVGGSFCKDRTALNMLLFTALGQPITVDFIPFWGNRKHSHSWNVLLTDSGHYISDPFDNKDGWILDSLYANRGMYHPGGLGEFRAPKVYRKTYSSHPENSLWNKGVPLEDIPELFLNYKKVDVTEKYVACTDVEVTLTEQAPEGACYAYLCVYQYGGWRPVQCGRIENGKARFEKMGRHIVYMPMYCRNREMIPAAPPVLVWDDGSTYTLPAEGVSRECLLTRNIIAETFRNDSYIKSMRGTVITSASGDTLCRINNMLPIRRTSFPMAHPKAVRHVRLHLPSDSLCLGELSFHADGRKIEGVRITSQLNPCRSDEPVSHLFDDYAYTCCRNKVPSRYVDVDLGGTYRLDKVVMMPYVVSQMFLESRYELSCWRNSRWEVLDTQYGTTDNLMFRNLPDHAMFRIRQISRGENDREVLERPFVYKNGEVIWL